MERRKGHGRQTKDGSGGTVGGSARGSRFMALNEMEEGIEGEIDDNCGGKDTTTGAALEREDNVADLDLQEGKIKGKGKQVGRLIKKKGIVVSGSNVALKNIKPKVGNNGL